MEMRNYPLFIFQWEKLDANNIRNKFRFGKLIQQKMCILGEKFCVKNIKKKTIENNCKNT